MSFLLPDVLWVCWIVIVSNFPNFVIFVCYIGLLEKRRPNCRFFLGPAGSCLGYAQLLSFSIWGMAGLEAAPYLPPKSSLESSKSLEHWRTEIVPESSIGVQNIPMDARNNFSFRVPIRKCHLTHQDSTCPPSLELDPWRTGWVPDRSLHFNVSNNPTLWNYLKQ